MNRLKYAVLLPCALLVSLGTAGCLSSGGSDDGEGGITPPNSDNTPPTISGRPSASATVGQSYSFTPNASDADDDSLTFSISNQPGWASFDTSTGTLSGTPGMADIGTFDGILISVSDGQVSVSADAFGIVVSQIQTGSATLSWTAPTQNSDGSNLDDLVAYNIYYGTTQGSYPNKVEVDNASITTFLVEGLAPDTYYFVATAVNADGVESEFSNVVEFTVQ